jgi:hypothetical protein
MITNPKKKKQKQLSKDTECCASKNTVLELKAIKLKSLYVWMVAHNCSLFSNFLEFFLIGKKRFIFLRIYFFNKYS